MLKKEKIIKSSNKLKSKKMAKLATQNKIIKIIIAIIFILQILQHRFNLRTLSIIQRLTIQSVQILTLLQVQ